MTQTDERTANDPFTKFWTDMVSKMGAASPAAMPSMPDASASNESMKQMQRMFFDALSKYFDDFMRSEQFMSMMKQTMDRSLALKQQVDQFLTKLHHGTQTASASDMSDIAGTLRNIEDRLLHRMDAIEKKVAAVEEPTRTMARARASRAQRPSGRAATATHKIKKKPNRK